MNDSNDDDHCMKPAVEVKVLVVMFDYSIDDDNLERPTMMLQMMRMVVVVKATELNGPSH